MIIRPLVVLWACLQSVVGRHLRGQKCLEVENNALEPAVVVLRDYASLPRAQFAMPQDAAVRVRVPPAHQGVASRHRECFSDREGPHYYAVTRLSFNVTATTQVLYANAPDDGVSCFVEDNGDLDCRVNHAWH